MTLAQGAYLVALGVVAWMRGPVWPVQALVLNAVATLAACLALDLGALDRDNATTAMMVIDMATGVALLFSPGAGRIIALLYMITVPLYALSIVFGVHESTTFAIVRLVGFMQIAVAGIGSGSGDDRGNGHRLVDGPLSLAASRRIAGMGQVGVAAACRHLSQDRGGLK